MTTPTKPHCVWQQALMPNKEAGMATRLAIVGLEGSAETLLEAMPQDWQTEAPDDVVCLPNSVTEANMRRVLTGHPDEALGCVRVFACHPKQRGDRANGWPLEDVSLKAFTGLCRELALAGCQMHAFIDAVLCSDEVEDLWPGIIDGLSGLVEMNECGWGPQAADCSLAFFRRTDSLESEMLFRHSTLPLNQLPSQSVLLNACIIKETAIGTSFVK